MLTKKEILDNRKKWVKYLTEKRLYKHKGELQKFNGISCCCLGHGCNAFNITKKKNGTKLLFGLYGSFFSAPSEFVNLVGLHDSYGEFKNKKQLFFDTNTRKFYNSNNKNKTRQEFDSLVGLNDDTDATTKEIGMFIKAHINDGLIFEKV